MCTLTWQPTTTADGGYEVVFSRDEQRTRPIAEAPRYRTAGKRLMVAPLDPLGGGTWIFANERGITGCMLNRYDEDDRSAPDAAIRATSRGRLLLGLADAEGQQDLADGIAQGMASARYLPFILWVMLPGVGATIWVWDGAMLAQKPAPSEGILTTSAYNGPAVRRAREAAYASRLPLRDLDGFHRASDGPADAFGVRMSRPDARTVSLTRVRCAEEVVRMDYAPREGDGGFGETRTVTLGLALTAEGRR